MMPWFKKIGDEALILIYRVSCSLSERKQ